jgi:hypothetical protein
MTMSSQFVQPRIWRLLAIYLDPEQQASTLFALMLVGRQDEPLMVDGRIAFFTDRRRARELIEKYGPHLRADRNDVDEPARRCDIAQALHFLSAGGYDETASVLNSVNPLLDLVRASGIEMTEERKRVLYSIADYTTTSKDLTRYLEEEGDYPSRQLVDAVLWCVGAVVMKGKLV